VLSETASVSNPLRPHALSCNYPLSVAIEDTWWQVGCGGTVHKVLSGVWYGSVALIKKRPVKKWTEQRDGSTQERND
jgi:hypothetical protein